MTTTDPSGLAPPWQPVLLLEMPTDATPTEVERAGQRLLAVGRSGSAGAGALRNAARAGDARCRPVRQALATLRDPGATRAQRALGECRTDGGPASGDRNAGPWEEPSMALGGPLYGRGSGVIIVIFIVRMMSGRSGSENCVGVRRKLGIFVFAIAMVQVTAPRPRSPALCCTWSCLSWSGCQRLSWQWIVVPCECACRLWTVRVCWPLGLIKKIEAGAVV